MRYTLIVFDRGVGYPEEFTVLTSVFADDAVTAASCGPINICQFSSEYSKKDIYDRLMEKELEFILTEETEVLANYPKKIGEHFVSGAKLDEIKGELKSVSKRAKVSLKDQLDKAVAEDNFEAAAEIKKKMDALANPPAKVLDGETTGGNSDGEDKKDS